MAKKKGRTIHFPFVLVMASVLMVCSIIACVKSGIIGFNFTTGLQAYVTLLLAWSWIDEIRKQRKTP